LDFYRKNKKKHRKWTRSEEKGETKDKDVIKNNKQSQIKKIKLFLKINFINIKI
jgi:hypothetical protein